MSTSSFSFGGTVNGGVSEPVSQVGDNSSQDVVEEDDEGVVSEIGEEGGGVIPGWVFAEGSLVSRDTVGVLDVEEIDQGGGRGLEGLSTSPGSKGSEHLGTEDEPVELSGVGRAESHGSVLGGIVLVRGSGENERHDGDLNTKGEVGDDPGDLEGTEGT